MKAHRHHAPKTAIILILTSVLSFAFVACDASKKCLDSNGDDKEACEEACEDRSGKFWRDACEKVCNYDLIGSRHRNKACKKACHKGKNLSACSRSCKVAFNYEDCKYDCDHGDTAACENYEEYEKKQRELYQALDALDKEKAEKKEKEACHVTTWQLIGDVPNQSISNFSWRSASISIPEDAAIECAPTTGFIERFQTAVELGERPNPALLNRFSKELLKCGKAIGSNELVEVAKKCNGKWY